MEEALKACRSLRVLQLHVAGMPWPGVDGSYTAAAAGGSQPAYDMLDTFLNPLAAAVVRQQEWADYVAIQRGLVNCVVLPFRQPRCGQL
jgi:hypothetical protein